MKRITITIENEIPSDVAIDLVKRVMRRGRISSNSKGDRFYCFATLCRHNSIDGEIFVRTSIKSKAPNASFIVYKNR